jgi:hypothetical protein
MGMRREDLAELHYIVHFDNIISIIQRGILSNALSTRLPHKSVASEIVQEKRKTKSLPQGKSLHDYVNLYICGRNPMLFKLAFSCGYTEICVLSISPEVIDLPGVVVSDRNASSDYARFAHIPDGLLMVDKDRVFARYWNQPDPIEKYEHVSIKCAEVLVLDKVDPKYINKAYVSCQESKTLLDKRFSDAGLSINVVVDTYLFFK